MKVCGVIAEYNPFHCGHAFQLAETRRILGEDTAIVCVMSGNFVQRGDFAILEKYARAKAAALCGADLVLELPIGATLSSAEGFARGAVRSLDALGCVRFLSFGSECGSERKLLDVAALLDTPEADHAFRHAMQEGLSYAAARQVALQQAGEPLSELLSSPNDTLGIEYCRAIRMTDSLLSPLAIRRRGAGHNSRTAEQGLVSATLLRDYLQRGNLENCREYMPEMAFQILKNEIATGEAPVLAQGADRAMLSYLRRLDAKAFAEYERANEGLTYRLRNSIWDGVSFADACARAQTRRYPLARIRRAYFRAYLALPLETCAAAPEYLRVLAIGTHGRALLRRFSKTAKVPIVTKPLYEKKLPATMQPALLRDEMVDELYALAQPGQRSGGVHFRKTPYCAGEGHQST